MTRRSALTSMMVGAVQTARGAKRPAVLLRSSWQTVNIGDIAHTPGMLQILQEHVPECDVILWPGSVDRGVAELLQRSYPRLRIFEGKPEEAASPELTQVLHESDLFLHGSAASIGSHNYFDLWRRHSQKPFGFYGVGVTLDGEFASYPPATRDLVDHARFVYTRETASLRNLKTASARAPIMGFAPDATFSVTLRNEAAAERYLQANNLKPGKFLVAIPRLRFTPYERIRKVNYSPDVLKHRTEINDRYKEADHAKLREAIIAWVRQTGNPALIAPEMTYQIDIMDELVYDPLPADVKSKVLRKKDFWLTDEAVSVYARAASVLSFECHSPILAITRGTPCFYVHQAQDGIKGQMYRDLGLSNWYFEMDETSGSQLAASVLAQYNSLSRFKTQAREAHRQARRIHQETSQEIRRALGLQAI